jgi:hypothetical protein
MDLICGVSSSGRSFANGKALSKELRSLIIDKIIRKEGNTLTGQFNSSYSAIVRSVGCQPCNHCKSLETILQYKISFSKEKLHCTS